MDLAQVLLIGARQACAPRDYVSKFDLTAHKPPLTHCLGSLAGIMFFCVVIDVEVTGQCALVGPQDGKKGFWQAHRQANKRVTMNIHVSCIFIFVISHLFFITVPCFIDIAWQFWEVELIFEANHHPLFHIPQFNIIWQRTPVLRSHLRFYCEVFGNRINAEWQL